MYCGLDWAENHHDIALVNEAGELLAKQRITDDAAGYKILLDLLAAHGDTPQAPIPVAIETSHGLLVATLRTGTRQVYAVNPLSAVRPGPVRALRQEIRPRRRARPGQHPPHRHGSPSAPATGQRTGPGHHRPRTRSTRRRLGAPANREPGPFAPALLLPRSAGGRVM